MGIEAIYPRPNLSKPDFEHIGYPYLLKNLKIERPNQVWCSNITYNMKKDTLNNTEFCPNEVIQFNGGLMF